MKKRFKILCTFLCATCALTSSPLRAEEAPPKEEVGAAAADSSDNASNGRWQNVALGVAAITVAAAAILLVTKR